MLVRALPLIAAIAPIVGINVAYWIGATNEVLPTCIPYLEGCTSISSTGRYPPGDLLFRAIMLPYAAILVFTWYFALLWLKSSSPSARLGPLMVGSGVIGAIALVLYVSFLTSKNPFYEIMKTYGVYFYFAGTALAQLILSFALERSGLRRAMIWVVATPWVLGLINFAQKAILGSLNSNENRIEWIAALLMQIWFVLLWLEWRRTRFSLEVRTA